MNKRVLLAGLFHETHTFLAGRTALADFQVRRGEQMLLASDDGSPLAGVLGVAQRAGWTVLPSIDLRATPSATVADEVVECFWQEFTAVAERELAGGIDGVYLILHGAMASESYGDVEGEILARVSKTQPHDIPICGVLDLHANYSPRMARHGHGLIAYRENPHTDAQATAIRAAELLDRLMSTGQRPRTVFVPTPLVWPPTGVGTANDPMRWLEDEARRIEAAQPEILAVNVLAGYSFADTPDTGVSFSAVTLGYPAEAQRELQRLADWAVEHKELGNVVDRPIEQVMPQVAAARHGPVLLVEPADNIGGGAPGDATGVLQALLKHKIDNSVVVINDPQAVQTLAVLRPGETHTLPIGSKSNPFCGGPVALTVELISQSDGRFDLEDRQSHLASMHGIHIEMGPCAVVRHEGIRILLTSRKTPPFDLGQLRSQGIVPEECRVIGVKAAVAHRRAYDKIAKASYTVDTPGLCSSNLKSFPYRHIRRPVYPLDV